MSGLLSPVGPQPARVYWVRRMVVLAVPLILIIAIAVSCSGGGKSPTQSGSGPQTTTSSTPPAVNPNAPCTPADLTVATATDKQIYAPGDAPVFTATFTNTSQASCKLTLNPAEEIWTIKSGPAQYWSTAGCANLNPGNPQTTSMGPGATRTASVVWDGYRQEPGCQHANSSELGAYTLHFRLTGLLAGLHAQQVIFYIRQNTQ